MSQALCYLINQIPFFIYCRTAAISAAASSTCSTMMSSYDFVECYITNAALVSLLKLFFIHRLHVYFL